MFLHAFSSPDLSCHSGPQNHTGKHLGFPSDSILIYQGDEEYSFWNICSAACVLSVFLLCHVYTSPSRKLVQTFFGAKGKGEIFELHIFQKRPCRMLLKLLTRLREVFGRPLLHGRSIPPTSWTKLTLRKLCSENKSGADHLIHFNFFFPCLSFLYLLLWWTQALQWERAAFNRTEKNYLPPVTYFPSACWVSEVCPSFFYFIYSWAQKSVWAAAGLHKCAKEELPGSASQHALSSADKLVSGPEVNEVFRQNFSANLGISKMWTRSKNSVTWFMYFYSSFGRLKVQFCSKL